MKYQFLYLSLIALAVAGCDKDDDNTGNGNGGGSEAPSATYEVGDEGPAGGHVFFVDTDNEFSWTYLEAAPTDWSDSGIDPNLRFAWGQGLFPNINTNLGINSGLQNSEFLNEHTWNFPGVGSSMEYSVEINGTVYDDWFLPSLQELALMHDALHANGIGGFRTETNFGNFSTRVMYQSSSVQNGVSWFVNFEVPEEGEDRDGEEIGISVGDNRHGYVRPIRSF